MFGFSAGLMESFEFKELNASSRPLLENWKTGPTNFEYGNFVRVF